MSRPCTPETDGPGPGVREIEEVYCPEAKAERDAITKAVDDLTSIIGMSKPRNDAEQREVFRRLVKLMPESTADDEEDRIDYMCGALAARKVARQTLANSARWRAGFIQTFQELLNAGEA